MIPIKQDYLKRSKIIILLSLLILCQCKSGKEPDFLLKASHLVNENHRWYEAFIYFGELLEERSNGRIRFENYHSEQLAKEIEAIRLIQAGIIDMTTTSSSLSNWTDIMAFSEMPFLLRDSIDLRNLLNGPIGQRMSIEMRDNVGLRPVGHFKRGPRHLTSNRRIRHPDDLHGLIVRVPNVSSFVTAWDALGAKPTPMAFSEVFTSLQQGTIEARENPFTMINSAGFAEVQEYINLTSHVVSWVYPVIGEKQYQAFPDDHKSTFDFLVDISNYSNKLNRIVCAPWFTAS